ncbi:DUF3570 domain-containing protein [Rufibacter aurantiacus]|uniref:DUF3570 domain-containing protein n=1 Tax=Rufibacter aurantiacus TaxID=2817374 RepID=UPI001B31167F|nr:DUF3570 domain-containing protein [Rufibacter aurantiacus]
MQKIYLSASFFFLSILGSFAQTATPKDTTTFRRRKLKLEEINFVSSYYTQDGNNSAVTGGIGTEELTDVATNFDLTFTRSDAKNRAHTLNVAVGFDHYSSASSDLIDPTTISSASAADNRIYPSVQWSMRDQEKHYAVGAGLSLSTEYDYFSKGANVNFAKFSKDNNREFGVGLSAYLDTWTVIYPIELRTIETNGTRVDNPEAHGTKPRNTFNTSLSLAQVINKRLQLSLLLDLTYQQGQLGTLYQRVYFQDNSLDVERLPSSRFKVPVGIRAHYFVTDKLILRSFYRFYSDNWGIKAHTAELETPFKVTPFISLSPYYRFYAQTAADYFAGYQQHSPGERRYTSDYDLSKFTSHYAGLNFRITSVEGVFGIKKLNTLELRYGHYNRSNGLVSNTVSLAATLK